MRVQFGRAGKQSRCRSRTKVEDRVSDRDASARLAIRRAKDAKREILNGEIGMTFSGSDPTLSLRIVGFVERGHRERSSRFLILYKNLRQAQRSIRHN